MSLTYSRHYSITAQVILITCVVAFLLLYTIDSFWGVSVDVAHHYALIARIMELFGTPEKYDPSLGEMNIYPAGSHMLAAILGYFLNSPFLGLHVVSILSVILIWGVIFIMLLTLPGRSSILAATGVICLLILNRNFINAELFGQEIVANYFYAQLAGQAFAMVIIALQMHMERNGVNPILRHLAMTLFIYICVSIHILPALELLGFYCIYLFLDIILEWQESRQGVLKKTVIGLTFVLLNIFLLLRHPYYLAMKEIATNNGVLPLRYFETVHLLAIFSIIVVFVSAILLLQWLRQDKFRTQFVAYKYFSCFGIATALLCLVQYVLLYFGSGSEYAVRKYIYAINTIFLLEVVLLVELFFRKYPAKIFSEWYSENVYHSWLLPAMGIVVSVTQILSSPRAVDVSSIVKMEKQIQILHDTSLPEMAGKASYVVQLRGVPNMINYMFSIGLLQAPRSKSAEDILSGRPLTDFRFVNTVITSENSSMDKYPSCRLGGNVGGFIKLDGNCEYNIASEHQKIYYFSEVGGVEDCQIIGFGDREEFGRWTVQKRASIRCAIPIFHGHMSRVLAINGSAFLENNLDQQRLLLSLNGGSAMEHVITRSSRAYRIEISLENIHSKFVELQLELPDAKSPLELGLSSDGRILGVNIDMMLFK